MTMTANRAAPSAPSGVHSLWYTRCPVPTASSVAITGGWLAREFAADHIAVRSLGESEDAALRLAHYTHAHPALFREGGVVPPLWASSVSGANRLLALAPVSQYQGFWAMRDSAVARSGSLRGARIALPIRPGQPIDFARAVSWHGIEQALSAAGVAADSVRLVDVPMDEAFLSDSVGPAGASLYTARENVRLYTAEALALVRGQVDAMYAAGPHALATAALLDAVPVAGPRSGTILAHGAGSARHLRILTVSTQLARERPDLVSRYVLALLRAANWAAVHRQEAWRTVAAEVGAAEEWARTAYPASLIDDLRLRVSKPLLDALQARADFLAQRAFVPARVDVRSWLDPDPLLRAEAARAAESEETHDGIG